MQNHNERAEKDAAGRTGIRRVHCDFKGVIEGWGGVGLGRENLKKNKKKKKQLQKRST